MDARNQAGERLRKAIRGLVIGMALAAVSGISGGPAMSASPPRDEPQGTLLLAASVDTISGTVTSPELGAVGKPQLQRGTIQQDVITEFEVAGTISSTMDEVLIEVQVLKDAAQSTAEDANWETVDTFGAAGSPPFFSFSAKSAPFRGRPQAWRPGGLGRLRVAAAGMGAGGSQQRALLDVVGADGRTPANATIIVLADASVNPTFPPGEIKLGLRNPFNFNTPNYLRANSTASSFPPGQLPQQTAAAADYYAHVGIEPDGRGSSIASALPTLRRFIDHYFRPLAGHPQDEPEALARYFNNGDLGIGREMHCIHRGDTAELACYVKNFGRLDGTPLFDDMGQARRALLANRPFATVAMVERRRMEEGAANRVFFIVYLHKRGSASPQNTELALQAPLDNKGYNTSIPGNCLQCHGINAEYSFTLHVEHKVENAIFLPFDLDAFKFFGDDDESPLSRERQESRFRAFNRMVRTYSSLARSAEAAELIEDWYADDLSDEGGKRFRAVVPIEWQGSPSHEGLYEGLVAVACRTCHISFVPSVTEPRSFLSFGTADKFLGSPALQLVRLRMCDPSQRKPAHPARPFELFMPAAEQTMKILWRSPGRAFFFGQAPGVFGDCGL